MHSVDLLHSSIVAYSGQCEHWTLALDDFTYILVVAVFRLCVLLFILIGVQISVVVV